MNGDITTWSTDPMTPNGQQAALPDSNSTGRTVFLDLPANYTSLNILDACIIEILEQVEYMAEPAIIINDIRVAVQEACTIIIEHAYADQERGRIAVAFTLDEEPRCLRVELHHTGSLLDFEPPDQQEDVAASLNPEEPETRGYGLFLLYTLMDDVTYTPQPGNNRWVMTRHLV
jgi:anti-sigma regulatory factor (Ser/Thr protein kinase)